ncbi:CP family cyanate transporter-like MFS transporter [Cytobacillus firmus]|uniref:CP family cyanate transporter-like MFS transporter n=2 Tax=Cytobacillus TaxID=2675230 RepID=A0A366JEL0_CYTFI|nr:MULTISPECIES: MFS transporter [Cytobacillus]RBP85401.1 CP family cyanate transporter-like MFS transporter [Cytobacillus firmus]TDX35484.1 CP family cyanate transporter-like MFS transporter [Cytobacillus oceanisediminis]
MNLRTLCIRTREGNVRNSEANSHHQGIPAKAGNWLPIAALFIASLNLRPTISSISPMLEVIRKDLDMNAFTASLLTSIPVLCMGFLSPLSIRFGKHIGFERGIACSLVLITGGTLLRMVAHSTPMMLLTAVLTGIGIAVMGPLLSGYIKKHFFRNIPIMIALYSMALSLGAALGASLSAPIQMKLHSWQTALAFWALLAVTAVPVWYAVIKQQVYSPIAEAPEPSQTSALPWGNKKAWLLTIHFGLMALVFYSLMGWLPPMMESAGYSSFYAGMLLTMFALVQIPSGLVVHMLLKRFPSRLVWLLSASFLQLIGLILIFFATLPWLAALLCGFGCGMLFTLGSMLPIDEAANPHEAASWAAMTQSVGYMIGAIGPVFVGWVNDTTNKFGFAIAVLILITLILAVVQWLIVPRKEKSAVETSARTMNRI